jgi:hypothetical protein
LVPMGRVIGTGAATGEALYPPTKKKQEFGS